MTVGTLNRVARDVGVSGSRPLIEGGRALDNIATVIWCTGFRPDFGWIKLPIVGEDGYPRHRRGIISDEPNLGFVGLRYQYRVGSSLLGGVAEDAEYVVTSLRRDVRRAA